MQTAPIVNHQESNRDYWFNRCRVAEDRVERLLRDSLDQSRGALVGMAITGFSGLVAGYGLGWWLA